MFLVSNSHYGKQRGADLLVCRLQGPLATPGVGDSINCGRSETCPTPRQNENCWFLVPFDRSGPALPILLVFSLNRWPNRGWQVPNAVVRNMHYLR
jgi:hypothetical protein